MTVLQWSPDRPSSQARLLWKQPGPGAEALCRPEPVFKTAGRGRLIWPQCGRGLPPARHLAAVTGVNINTVLRALRALRDEGLLEMRPRRGIRVVGTPEQSQVRNKVAELVQLARQQGYTRAELLEMITEA
jgi:GntR family transcriptional regulator